MATFFFPVSGIVRSCSILSGSLALSEGFTRINLDASQCCTATCHGSVRWPRDSSTFASCGPDRAMGICLDRF